MKRAHIRMTTALLLGLMTFFASAAWQTAENIAYVEKQTGLSFPTKIGLLEYQGTEEYDEKELGVAIGYGFPSITLNIYVYNLGLKTIPSGAKASIIRDAMDGAMNDIKGFSEEGKYSDLVVDRQEVVYLASRPVGPRARHVSMSFTLDVRRLRSHLFVFGYRNQFIKIRFSYTEGAKAIGEDQLKILTNWLSEVLQKAELPG